MQAAVYNSVILKVERKSVNRASCSVTLLCLFCALLMAANPAQAADWSAAEQQLARKVIAVTGPGAVSLTINNRSSLGRRESDVAQNGLRLAFEQVGLRIVNVEQAAASITIALSENPTSYVWVAEIRQGASDNSVVMVSIPRAGRTNVARDSMPMTLRKTLLWAQDDPMLDLAVLEENGVPTHIAILNPDNVVLYRTQNGKWQQEQVLEIAHSRPWPRDLRGRLIPARDHLLDVYLPGVVCHTGAGSVMTLGCHEGDDPWPVAVTTNAPVFPSVGSAGRIASPVAPVAAFFAPTRNFFTGVLTPAVGKFNAVPKFYSAAFVPRDKYTLWLFAGTDGKIHIVDGMNDQASKSEWGSDIASVHTSCGAGTQVLAVTSGGQGQDSVRAYEFPDRDAVAVTGAADFPGAITAFWTEARGDTALAIVKDRDSGSYEAFRLELACNQ